jgi:hypothetical protein
MIVFPRLPVEPCVRVEEAMDLVVQVVVRPK